MNARALALALLITAPLHAADLPLIPRPERLEERPGAFSIDRARRILLLPDEPPVRKAALELVSFLATRGTTLPVVTSNPPAPGDFIMEKLPSPGDLGPEGYRLDITPQAVTLRAPTAMGFQHGVRTLAQLAFAPSLPALSITDRPRFRWRGVMIDTARHFRSAAWIRRLLDQMAFYKLNVLHWHLTDDQGWRVPIARLPRLAKTGETYTPQEIDDVVGHAAGLSIRVVPEVDVPGHVSAALSAYPDLSCRAVKLPVPDTWGTFDHVLCPGSESPFVFLTTVVDELAARFPDPYLHLGGNEVPRTRWRECSRCSGRVTREGLRSEDELQAYFLRRATGILGQRGRRPIVWDDDRAHGFPAATVVQAWHGDTALLEAATAGHDVIASPESHLYLNRPALMTPLSRVLAFDPVPRAASPQQAARVLGAEACLWSEYIRDDAEAERALFPRLFALAETVWSPAAQRDGAEFARRLPPHRARLARAGIAWGDPGTRLALLTPRQLAGDWRQVKLDVTALVEGPGVYSVALGADTPVPVDILAMSLTRDGKTMVQILRETTSRRDLSERIYDLELGERPAGGRWILELVIRCQGPHAGTAAVWLERRPLK